MPKMLAACWQGPVFGSHYYSMQCYYSIQHDYFFKIFWIRDGFLDPPWISGFTMDVWIQDAFLDWYWLPWFTMDYWIHDGFMDSQWIPRFTMNFWKPHTSDYDAAGAFSQKNPPICLEALHIWLRCCRLFFSRKMSPYVHDYCGTIISLNTIVC